MGKITSTDIIAALPTLSPDELVKVRETANFLSNNKSYGNNEKYEWLYDAVIQELSVHGIKRYLPFRAFTTTTYFRKFKSGCDEVMAFMDEVYPELTRREEKLAICRTLINSLIRDLNNKNIPITLNVLAKNIQRLPEVFEMAFPDYISSGLAHLIPMQMKRLGNVRTGK